MAKGDSRTRRGKIWKGSHGKTRPGREKPAAKEKASTKRK